MPVLKALWAKYTWKIVIITIAVDPSYDDVTRLKNWMHLHNVSWIHARDADDLKVSKLYKVTAIPTFIITDKNGIIRYRHFGLISENILSREISALINE